MGSNFIFGLVAISEVNGILVLLAQIILLFSLYPIMFGLVRTHFEENTEYVHEHHPKKLGTLSFDHP